MYGDPQGQVRCLPCFGLIQEVSNAFLEQRRKRKHPCNMVSELYQDSSRFISGGEPEGFASRRDCRYAKNFDGPTIGSDTARTLYAPNWLMTRACLPGRMLPQSFRPVTRCGTRSTCSAMTPPDGRKRCSSWLTAQYQMPQHERFRKGTNFVVEGGNLIWDGKLNQKRGKGG